MSLMDRKLERHSRRQKRIFGRQGLAWFLIVCICTMNINMAAFAAEPLEGGAGNSATPSDADVTMPGEPISSEELLAEAERAVTNGYKFDFDKTLELLDADSDDEEAKEETNGNVKRYKDMFKGYESFALFYDNGEGGRITGDEDSAYGYILVRLSREEYQNYEAQSGAAKPASNSDADEEATSSDADGRERYLLNGDEDLIFLYINGTDIDATFNLNLEDMETSEITVPSVFSIRDTEEEETKEEAAESEPADSETAGVGTDEGGSGESGTAGTDETEGKDETGTIDETTAADETVSADETTAADEASGKDETTAADEAAGKDETTAADETAEKDETTSDETVGKDETDKAEADSGSTSGGDSITGSEDSKKEESSDTSEDEGKTESGNSSANDETNDSDSEEESLVSISSYNVPRVMGPNPDAAGEETDDGLTFEEWQDEEEEDEEDNEEYYDDADESEYESSSYEDEEGVRYLNLSTLPAVAAKVKRPAAKSRVRMLFAAKAPETTVSIMSSSVPVREFKPHVSGYHKQIEYLGQDEYKLYLDLSGRRALDILLVIDTSGSMDDSWGWFNTRLSILKKALNGDDNVGGLIDQIYDPNNGGNSENRVAITTYNHVASVKKIGREGKTWSGNITDIKQVIKNLSPNGGTNYEDALHNAETALGERGVTDNIPIVLFLSDGEPTFFNVGEDEIEHVENNKWNTYHYVLEEPSTYGGRADEYTLSKKANSRDYYDGNYVGYQEDYKTYYAIAGNGSGTPDAKTSEESIAAADGFYENQAGENSVTRAVVYSIGFGGVSDWKYLKHIAYGNMADAQEGRGARVYQASTDVSNSNPLKDIFDDIMNQLEFKNVVISDTLSAYADFADNADAKIEKKLIGSDTWESADGTTTIDGKTITASVNGTGDKNALDLQCVYRLSFKIKVSEAARQYYKENGYYPNMGDADTDYEDNTTSSEQGGFFSNESANVSFGPSYDDDDRTKLTYKHPVIQVSEVYEPLHQKYIKDNKDGTYTLTLNVKSEKQSSEDITTTHSADIMFVIDTSASMKSKMSEPGNGNMRGSWHLNAAPGDKARALALNEAIDAVLELGNDDYDVRFGGYTFAQSSSNFKGWYPTSATAADWLKLKQDGNYATATQPSEALKNAIATLKNGRTDAKKYLIFLTDGNPTERESLSTDAVKGIQIPGLTFYAVRVTDAVGESFMNSLVNTINSDTTKAEDVSAEVLNGSTADGLKESLEEIKENIKNTITRGEDGVENAVIKDQLSEYAELVSVDEEIKVVRSQRGQEDYTLTNEECTITVSDNGKTIRAAIKGELQKDAIYSLIFDVKPTQKAIDEYLANSAEGDPYSGITGDANTDAPDNDTSSGKPGFRSNQTASLTYDYGSNTGNSLEYDHPVLQVSQGKLQIRKIIRGTEEDQSDIDTDKEFIIHVKKGDAEEDYTTLTLTHGKVSPYIYVNGETHFSITETVPMEYTKEAGIVIISKDGSTYESQDGIVTVKPGDDLLVEVYNDLGHKDYFHGDASVTNRTTGGSSEPFKSSEDAAEAVARNAPAAIVNDNKELALFSEVEEGE